MCVVLIWGAHQRQKELHSVWGTIQSIIKMTVCGKTAAIASAEGSHGPKNTNTTSQSSANGSSMSTDLSLLVGVSQTPVQSSVGLSSKYNVYIDHHECTWHGDGAIEQYEDDKGRTKRRCTLCENIWTRRRRPSGLRRRSKQLWNRPSQNLYLSPLLNPLLHSNCTQHLRGNQWILSISLMQIPTITIYAQPPDTGRTGRIEIDKKQHTIQERAGSITRAMLHCVDWLRRRRF